MSAKLTEAEFGDFTEGLAYDYNDPERKAFVLENAIVLLHDRDHKIARQAAEIQKLRQSLDTLRRENHRLNSRLAEMTMGHQRPPRYAR